MRQENTAESWFDCHRLRGYFVYYVRCFDPGAHFFPSAPETRNGTRGGGASRRKFATRLADERKRSSSGVDDATRRSGGLRAARRPGRGKMSSEGGGRREEGEDSSVPRWRRDAEPLRYTPYSILHTPYPYAISTRSCVAPRRRLAAARCVDQR